MKALVVDDSALMRKAISAILTESGGFEVSTARDGADALEAIPRIRPDVVTLDINMPVMDGLTCLARIMKECPVPVVMVSSLSVPGALVTLEALELGAVDFVEKPGGTVSLNLADAGDELVEVVRRAARANVRAMARGHRAGVRPARDRLGRGPGAPVSRPARTVPPTSRTRLVVVGASTGGPAVLSMIIENLPRSFPAPVVIAQHMPSSFTAALAQRLDGSCALAVEEIDGVLTLRPGHVYISRGDADTLVARRPERLVARPAPVSEAHRWHPSVSRLVASALDAVPPDRVIGVLLTGMGDDGAAEMALLRRQGGRTIAQTEESSVVWGMPGQLVAQDGATVVLDPRRISDQLLAWT
jgi:two-component system chemotaxis response regulator CheB